MKFGQNRIIYNYTSGNPDSWNQFTRWVNRKKVLVISVIAIAIGVYFLLRTPIYTTQVDFKVTNVDTVT